MTTHHVHHPTIPVRTYFVIFVILMVLLAATMAASYIHYDEHPHIASLGVAIALAIAFTKAALVVLYFMHVKLASPLTRIFVVAGLLWLGIMITLTFSDYLTRGWLPAERGWSQHAVIPKP